MSGDPEDRLAAPEVDAPGPEPEPSPPPRRAWKAARSYLLMVTAAFVLGRLLAESTWWSALLLYVPQGSFLAPLAVLLPWSTLARDGAALAANTATLALILGPMMGFNAPMPRLPPPADAPRLRVLTYNIRGATYGYGAVFGQVDHYRPDVVIFQEAFGWADDDRTRRALAERFAGWSMVHAGDVFIASRWPVIQRDERPLGPAHMKYSGDPRQAVRVLVDGPFGRFNVVGVHFYTAMAATTLRREWRDVGGYIRGTLAARARQMRELQAWLGDAHTPLVLAGDFNTPPQGRVYRDLRRFGGDCFADSAWGWGYTYSSRLPMLRIDHIIHSWHWHTLQCNVGAAGGSDHRAVFAEMALIP